MASIASLNERIIIEIKRRAALFCADNFTVPTPEDLLVIENAMLIGASIAFENEAAETHGDNNTLLKELFDQLSLEKELVSQDKWRKLLVNDQLP